MLSNYPPGVSGNEPEIAGYPEIEAYCGSDDFPVVPSFVLVNTIGDLLSDRKITKEVYLELTRLIADEQLDSGDDCQYHGPIQVTEAQIEWTCPSCGSERVTSLDDDPYDY